MVHDDAWNMVTDETGKINNRSSKKSLSKTPYYSSQYGWTYNQRPIYSSLTVTAFYDIFEKIVLI